MSKINLLVLPSDRTGVGKYRSVDPHKYLSEHFPEEFNVTIDYDPDIDNDEYWKNYDIVHFHRVIKNSYHKTPLILNKLKSWGIKTIMDIDDYWLPGSEHPAYSMIKIHGIDKLIIDNIKNTEFVTTTTELFAEEIRKFNKNVFVIPNAVDVDEEQFKEKTVESDKVRFGWLGGSSHLHDIMLLDGATSKISSLKDKFEFYLCGFDTRGSITQVDPKTKQSKKRDIKPEETVWFKYEKILTNNYNLVDSESVKKLMEFNAENYTEDDFYKRIWTAPIGEYAKNYARFDVSLAPLKDTIFNRLKSQLKVIEAGFYKKAIIASNIGPYTLDLKHSLDKGNFTDGNALLVDKHRNKSDWSKYMKKLIQNPNFVIDLGERLYETVSGKYDLKSATELRREIYKTL
jgi:glycosyltransferase involved in cell wall biosynthesis